MKAEDDLKDRAEARVGKVLRDKWVLDRLLGLGGMAAVYSATHRNGKHAAIKILHPEAALVPDIRARFLREGYLANKVGHAGTVSILDDDVDVDGTVFLVMELLSGETLESAWLHSVDSRLPWEFALVVAYQVLDVLHAAHQKNIVHRDLKPANIFLDATGKAKVLDFGIARLHTASPVGGTGRDTALGTPGYMPPEQARGHWDKVDAQSDLWALGATLFATLAARLVHDGTTVNEQLLSAMTQPAPALGSVAPEIPAEVAAIVDRALAFEKAQRWSDARAMQEEVRRVYELLKGKSIAQAGPLAITVRARSVAPDAPTVAADQSSTARPVGRNATTARKQRRLQLPLLFVGGAVLALGTAAMLFKRGPASEPELGQKASAAIAPAVLATTAAALPVEPPPVEPPAAAPSASASAPASAAPKVAVAPGPHKARPKPSARAASKAAPAVAADFDLNRRK